MAADGGQELDELMGRALRQRHTVITRLIDGLRAEA